MSRVEIITDAVTSEQTVRPYTQAEEDAADAAQLAAEAASRAGLSLTFAQLLFGLVAEKWITEAEGTAWLVNRTLPAAIEAILVTLPANQQLLARARALQPAEVMFVDPMVQSLGQSSGKTEAEMADFFRTYAAV